MRIVGSDVRGMRLRGRQQIEWMDDGIRVLNETRMSVEDKKIIVHDRC